MKILGSTQYVDLSKQTEPWYQLQVTNQWDFSTMSICCQRQNETVTIYFHLTFNTPVDDRQYKSEKVIDVTQEMKDELKKMGYIVF